MKKSLVRWLGVSFVVSLAIVLFTKSMEAQGRKWQSEHRPLPMVLRWPLQTALRLNEHLPPVVAGVFFLGLIVGVMAGQTVKPDEGEPLG